jgi:hypothetical protein
MSITIAAKVQTVINDILRDKASGWVFNYFGHSSTSADTAFARAMAGLDRQELQDASALLQIQLAEMECSRGEGIDLEKKAAVESMRGRLEGIKREMSVIQNATQKQALYTEAEDLRVNIVRARKDMEDMKTREIHRLKALLEKNRLEINALTNTVGNMRATSWSSEVLKWSRIQDKERKRRRALQELRNGFMVDGDMDSLTQGVYAVESV